MPTHFLNFLWDGSGFNYPKGVAVDRLGNVYVVGYDSHTIRKITPAGVVSTLAGSVGVRGYADGIGSNSLFADPEGVAVDADGQVYVADTYNYTIRVGAAAAVNDAPTLTSVSPLTGATEDTPFTITYSALAAAANEADVDGDVISFRVEAVSSGTLTKNGTAVTPGSTLLGTGESLVWTPVANANGTLNAFTVKAWDGNLASSTPVQVQVNVTAVNDAPTGANSSVTTPEDTAYTFSVADFGFSDPNDSPANTLQAVKITTLPSAGTLTSAGSGVNAGDFVPLEILPAGATWTARENDRNWYSVASSADGTKLVAVTAGGQIYTSTDFGVTWMARETSLDGARN